MPQLTNNTGATPTEIIELTPSTLSGLIMTVGNPSGTIPDVGATYNRNRLNDIVSSLGQQINELKEVELPTINQNLSSLTEQINLIKAYLGL